MALDETGSCDESCRAPHHHAPLVAGAAALRTGGPSRARVVKEESGEWHREPLVARGALCHVVCTFCAEFMYVLNRFRLVDALAATRITQVAILHGPCIVYARDASLMSFAILTGDSSRISESEMNGPLEADRLHRGLGTIRNPTIGVNGTFSSPAVNHRHLPC